MDYTVSELLHGADAAEAWLSAAVRNRDSIIRAAARALLVEGATLDECAERIGVPRDELVSLEPVGVEEDLWPLAKFLSDWSLPYRESAPGNDL